MSKLILIVTDDPDSSIDLTFALLQKGFRVRLATNREDALYLVDNEITVDLAITDLQLPGTSGEKLASELRKKVPSIPVFKVSGRTDMRMLTDELRQGNYSFINNIIDYHVKMLTLGNRQP